MTADIERRLDDASARAAQCRAVALAVADREDAPYLRERALRDADRCTETHISVAVSHAIAARPDLVVAIIRAAIRRAPAYREAIALNATIDFPAFAPQIAAALGR